MRKHQRSTRSRTSKKNKIMIIENLRAEYGDAFVIKTTANGEPYTIVVDGGPYSTRKDIAEYYTSLGRIDLMILTHYDEDHILGLLKYMQIHADKPLPVVRFWGNCAEGLNLVVRNEISDTGDRNAATLAAFLRKQHASTPEFFWYEDIMSPQTFTHGDLRIDILSPHPEFHKAFKEHHDAYLKAHPMNDDDRISDLKIAARYATDNVKSIDTLLSEKFTRDVNEYNMDSIAFLLTAEGKRVLMMGDADPDIVAEALKAIPNITFPIDIDAVKVSHHGSRNNMTANLLNIIHCNKFIFSTNGGTRNAHHPDKLTLALIARETARTEDEQIELLFNYELETILKRTIGLLTPEEQASENCSIVPEKVTIEL